LLYGGWDYGGGFPGCQYITHEADTQPGGDGQLALHLSYPSSNPLNENTTFNGVEVESGNSLVGNAYTQGFFSITYRMVTTPAVPAPQFLTPGVNFSFYGGADNTEFDVHEVFALIAGTCFDMNVLDHSQTGQGGFLNMPCVDSNQYHTYAMRVTGDGVGTRGYTGYVDGVVQDSYFRGYAGGDTNPSAGNWQIWNNPYVCAFGQAPCSNAQITSVGNCNDGSGLTCVNLNTSVYFASGSPGPNCSGNSAFIVGATGIAGLNGLHHPCFSTNPSATIQLTDLPWPGGTYGGGGQWNPLTQSDVWVKNVQFWTCPAYDPTTPYTSGNQVPNTQCNSTALAGAP
jgi:hypothetical protein